MRYSLFLKIESELIFTIVILQFKTGVRMPLTSQIKELGAILQKLIKYEPGRIEVIHDYKHLKWLASMAMRMSSDLGSLELGSVQRRETNETKIVLTRTRTERKKAVIVSVWLKKLLKEYNTNK